MRVGGGVELLQHDLWVQFQQFVTHVLLDDIEERLAVVDELDDERAIGHRLGVDVPHSLEDDTRAIGDRDDVLDGVLCVHGDSNLLERGRLSPKVPSNKSILLLYQVFTKKSTHAIILTDEKVPSHYIISRDVYGCIRGFYDVEGAEQ